MLIVISSSTKTNKFVNLFQMYEICTKDIFLFSRHAHVSEA